MNYSDFLFLVTTNVTVTTLAANTATVIQITVLLLSPVCGEFIPCSTEPCSVEPLIVPESLGVAGSVGLTGISSFFSKAAIVHLRCR